MAPEARSRRKLWSGKVGSAVVALLLPLCPAGAQEFHENLRHVCQDYWMLTRQEILECLRRDYAQADAELNRVYRERMASLSPAERRVLRAAQRAWLRRYDAVLTSYYAKPWANHSLVKVLPSQIRAVRDRTAYLRAYRP